MFIPEDSNDRLAGCLSVGLANEFYLVQTVGSGVIFFAMFTLPLRGLPNFENDRSTTALTIERICTGGRIHPIVILASHTHSRARA